MERSEMATNFAAHSVSILDADGNVRAIPLYFKYDSGASLSSILAYCAVTLLDLDAILDGQIVKQSISLDIALPSSGIKTAPVAGSNVQETGLITYLTDAPVKRSFGQDLPAFAQAKFVGKVIDLADTDVTTWTDRFIATGATLIATNQDFLAGLVQAVKGVKTFRKHRK
jgi:hypothetical protein